MQKTHNPFLSEDEIIIPSTGSEPGYARESVLVRGLQVPSRFSYVTSGFKYPIVLRDAGVGKAAWSGFTHEIKSLSHMNSSQWLTTVSRGAGTALAGAFLVGFFSLIPAVAVAQKTREHRETWNFMTAAQSGALAKCVNRWNETYFKAKGLLIRVDVPGETTDMNDMDLSTSRLYRYNQGDGKVSANGSMSIGHEMMYKYEVNDGKARVRASLKGRIVIIPLNPKSSTRPNPSEYQPLGRIGLDGLEEDWMSDTATEVPDDTSDAGTEIGNDEVTIYGRAVYRRADPYPNEPKP